LLEKQSDSRRERERERERDTERRRNGYGSRLKELPEVRWRPEEVRVDTITVGWHAKGELAIADGDQP